MKIYVLALHDEYNMWTFAKHSLLEVCDQLAEEFEWAIDDLHHLWSACWTCNINDINLKTIISALLDNRIALGTEFWDGQGNAFKVDIHEC